MGVGAPVDEGNVGTWGSVRVAALRVCSVGTNHLGLELTCDGPRLVAAWCGVGARLGCRATDARTRYVQIMLTFVRSVRAVSNKPLGSLA